VFKAQPVNELPVITTLVMHADCRFRLSQNSSQTKHGFMRLDPTAWGLH